MINRHLRQVVAALGRAADRRGLTAGSEWTAVHRALSLDHDLSIDQDMSVRSADRAEADGGADADAQLTDDPLRRVGAVFGLREAEIDLLLVTAAADIDPNIAVAYGLLLSAGGSPKPPSVALAMELAGVPLLDGRGRLLLGQTEPLRRWGLVRLGPGPLLLGRALTAGEDLIGALLGHPVPEPTSVAMAVDVAGSGELGRTSTPGGSVVELAAGLSAGVDLAWVEEQAGTAGVDTVLAAFERANLGHLTFDLARRPPAEPLVDVISALVRRCGLLASGMVLLSAELLEAEPDVIRAIAGLWDAPVPTVLIARSRWNPSWHPELPLVVAAEPVPAEVRLALWRRYVDEDDVATAALTPYRLSPQQIDAAGRHVTASARLSNRRPDANMISQTVRLLGGSRRLQPGTGWTRTSFDDLQVPVDTRASLLRLSSWVRLRHEVTGRGLVHGTHGQGTGIVALFTGSPGTGKTLAAHVIADSVGLDLMQVDLSGVIDKYIGETEKNLERIFTEAESLNVVLFFDEADALFGSRSEVRDARDRYANQEVSYLLQRMEQFNGITVLATNLRGNLDPAFSRRMDFIVHFPDPDGETRRRMWEQMLSRVGGTDPVDPVDYEMLAGAVELTGGALRNIVLSATYDAAADQSAVGQRHLRVAARREYTKLGRRPPTGLE